MTDTSYIRRNIHTYPFKYRHVDVKEYFGLDKAVIYIHIPFCTSKCHFCDYVVYTNTKADLREAYVDALITEIREFPKIGTFPRFAIDGVYVGGGTPGLLEADQLVRILDAVRATFQTVADLEVAVEFDPACVTDEKLAAIRAAGYTRFSMGVQSFDEDILRQNNRPHELADCYRAWESVRRAGFSHTNIDLIYPLLGLSLDTWRYSLAQAIAMEPACITAYPLEIWPKTAYHRWLVQTKEKILPTIDDEVAMCRIAFDMLEDAGFVRYSTSGYYHPARCDTYSRYLEYYWRTYPLIGFGVSSKSVINNRLYTNIRSIGEYIKRIRAGDSVMDFAIALSKEQEMRRVLIRGLKMNSVSRREFRDRFGVDMTLVFGKEIADLERDGLIERDADGISLTREGQVFSSTAFEAFYTEEDLRPPENDEVEFGLSVRVVG